MAAPPITSTANPRIKAAIALRDRRERDSRGLTIVDGVRELRRALDGGIVIDEAFVCPAQLDGPAAGGLVERLHETGVGPVEVSEAVFARLAFGDRSEGVIGIVAIPPTGLDRLIVGDDALIVVLDGLEKPGNLGAILRSADGAGADAVIMADPRTDPYNPNVIRASLGTVFSIPVATAGARDARAWLDRRRIRVVATRVEAPLPYTAVDLRAASAIVLGTEAMGLGQAWSGGNVVEVSVPMRGVADSLNVSATAAILLYEARRQRDAEGESPASWVSAVDSNRTHDGES